MYKDYLDGIHDFKSQEERLTALKILLDVDSETNFTIQVTKNTMFYLYKRMAEEHEHFAQFRIAESYRLGDFFPQNDTLAYIHYIKVLFNNRGLASRTTENSYIYSQSFYHCGYMRHYGIGTQKNLTEAISNYKNSMLFNDNSGWLALYMMKLAELERSNSSLLLLFNNVGDLFSYKEKGWNSPVNLQMSTKTLERFPYYILTLCLIGLFILRLRLSNYMNIFLSNKQ